MFMLTQRDEILMFQLLSIRGRVKLEGLGMKFNGRSATAIAKEKLGLAKNTPRADVIKALNELIEDLKAV